MTASQDHNHEDLLKHAKIARSRRRLSTLIEASKSVDPEFWNFDSRIKEVFIEQARRIIAHNYPKLLDEIYEFTIKHPWILLGFTIDNEGLPLDLDYPNISNFVAGHAIYFERQLGRRPLFAILEYLMQRNWALANFARHGHNTSSTVLVSCIVNDENIPLEEKILIWRQNHRKKIRKVIAHCLYWQNHENLERFIEIGLEINDKKFWLYNRDNLYNAFSALSPAHILRLANRADSPAVYQAALANKYFDWFDLLNLLENKPIHIIALAKEQIQRLLQAETSPHVNSRLLALNQPWIDRLVLQAFLRHKDSITKDMDNSKVIIELSSIIRKWRIDNSGHYYSEIDQFQDELTARIKACAHPALRTDLVKALQTDWGWRQLLKSRDLPLGYLFPAYFNINDDILKSECLAQISSALGSHPDLDECLAIIKALGIKSLFDSLLNRRDLNKEGLAKIGLAANEPLIWQDILRPLDPNQAAWVLDQIDSLETLVALAYQQEQNPHLDLILQTLDARARSVKDPIRVFHSLVKYNGDETINQIGEQVIQDFFADETLDCLAAWIIKAVDDEFTEMVLKVSAPETPDLNWLIEQVALNEPEAFGAYSAARTIRIIILNQNAQTSQNFHNLAHLTGRKEFVEVIKQLIR